MAIPSDSDLPITAWLEQAKHGREEGLEQIWQLYFSRLVQLARKATPGNRDLFLDEEDIVQSTLASFYSRIQEGQYPELNDRQGLWKLLISITLNKARALSRKEGRRRELLEERFTAGEFFKTEPTPDFAAQMTEQIGILLDRLDKPLLRRIAVAKLEGFTNAQIAEQIGKSVPTVERKLRLIRHAWSAEM